MKLASHLKRSRHGIFYFRIAVPADLHPLVGQTEIKRSLATRDPTRARAMAYDLSSKFLTDFRGRWMGSQSEEERIRKAHAWLRSIGVTGAPVPELTASSAITVGWTSDAAPYARIDAQPDGAQVFLDPKGNPVAIQGPNRIMKFLIKEDQYGVPYIAEAKDAADYALAEKALE